MSIDRIGKGGPVAPPETLPEAKTGRVFEVRAEKTEASVSAVQIANVTTPLERLQAGQVDVNGYLDLKVEEATSHLKGLSPVELDAIQKMLRDQLVTDPALADLVKNAAGASPSLPED